MPSHKTMCTELQPGVWQRNGLIKEAEHIDYEWHDGKMKTRLEYRLLKHEWEQLQKTL